MSNTTKTRSGRQWLLALLIAASLLVPALWQRGNDLAQASQEVQMLAEGTQTSPGDGGG